MLTVYKGCRDGMLVKLEIDPKGPNNLGRSGVDDPDHAVYRCRSAKVVEIEHVLTGETAQMAISGWDGTFCYRVGDIVEEPNYCTDIEKVFGKGIYFYLTKEPAVFRALSLNWFEGYTGEWMKWYDDGDRSEHVWFKDGKMDGEWMQWYDNGQCWSHGGFKDGFRVGEWEWCYDNGQRWQHGWFKDGKCDGEWEEGYDAGERFQHRLYKDGKMIVEWWVNGTKVNGKTDE